MKLAIYTKGDKYLTSSELILWGELCDRYSIEGYVSYTGDADFASQAQNSGLKVYCSVEELDDDIKLVVSYGGDGNFLHTIDRFRERNLPILGINSGRLGFLANVLREELEEAVKAIVSEDYMIEERPLIEGHIDNEVLYAFNDITLQKCDNGMLSLKIEIDGEFVAKYMADGLIVASPSGSTAYSLSVGGAIIAPSCNCFIVTPIAPHNLNVRPLIINDNSEIVLSGESRSEKMLATFDNRSVEVVNYKKIKIFRSKYSVKLIKLSGNSFYKTIREKLMWAYDKRDITI